MKSLILHNICIAFAATLMFSAIAISGKIAVRGSADAPAETAGESVAEAIVPLEKERPSVVVAGPIAPIPAHPDRKYYDVELSVSQQNTVFDYCEVYDVPAELIFGIMSVESSYTASAVSSTHDYGIMQINSSNHRWLQEELGITDFMDFEQNVLCGVYMLSEYYHKYADIEKIAMCYHYGENGAISLWEQGVTATDYTSAVVQAIACLKETE